MFEIKIKPLSVNEAWQGRRFKTVKYKSFEKEMLFKLKMVHEKMFKHENIHLYITFFFSNKASDCDNPIKMTQDVLSKKYKFNDNKVMDLSISKRRCKKGSESIMIHAKESDYNWDKDIDIKET